MIMSCIIMASKKNLNGIVVFRGFGTPTFAPRCHSLLVLIRAQFTNSSLARETKSRCLAIMIDARKSGRSDSCFLINSLPIDCADAGWFLIDGFAHCASFQRNSVLMLHATICLAVITLQYTTMHQVAARYALQKTPGISLPINALDKAAIVNVKRSGGIHST